MRGKKVSGQVGVSPGSARPLEGVGQCQRWEKDLGITALIHEYGILSFLSFASLKPQGSSASPATYVQPRLTRVSPPQGVTLDHAAAPPQTEAWGRGARRDHLLRG